jgi:hypothetical protein
LTVANAADMRAPNTPVVMRQGTPYHVQSCPCSSGILNMVSAEKDGHWVCLIGQMPADHLMDLAAKLKF